MDGIIQKDRFLACVLIYQSLWTSDWEKRSQYVEVTYLNINEETILSELYDLENPQVEESVILSEVSDHEAEEAHDTQAIEIVEAEHGTAANDFLSGKITFEDFINQVESSDEPAPTSDVSSDESDVDDSSDVDYVPDEKPATKKAVEASKEKVSYIPSM